MKNRIKLWVIVISLSLNLIFGLGYCLHHANSTSILPGIGRFIRVLQLVRRNYYDPQKIDTPKLIDAAIQGMVTSLDPWCEYLPPAQTEFQDNILKGMHAGIGIIQKLTPSGYQVLDVIPNTPAAQAGIQINDIITAVDGRAIVNTTPVPELRGKPETTIKLQILRGTEKLELSVKRAIYKLPIVRNVQTLEQNIGYFQICLFADSTPEAVLSVLKTFEAQHVKGLIIDLRGTPGGTVHSAVNICSYFLEEGQVVVIEKDCQGQDTYRYATDSEFHWPQNIPVILLVNQNTASASEIMAGCLKDYKKATLVGTKTFGKGVEQTVFNFTDGYSLKVTNYQFFTPKSEWKSIHKTGILPDVVEEKPSEDVIGAPQLANDSQLLKAWQLLTEKQNTPAPAQAKPEQTK